MSNCIMGLFGRTADAVAPYGTVKRATCLATLLQNEFNSDVALFATHIRACIATSKVARVFFPGW